jgi:hypothetical protein
VNIVRRVRFHRITRLVECKRWKDPVGRDRLDVLATSIEALGAQNGAIFTTTGFEEGAIAYAKGKGIALFLVRDLTPEEWGLLGWPATGFVDTWFRAMMLNEVGYEATEVQPRVQARGGQAGT